MLRQSMTQIESVRRPFTVDEYDRMVEAGILGREDHRNEPDRMASCRMRRSGQCSPGARPCRQGDRSLSRAHSPGKLQQAATGSDFAGARKDYYASKGPVTRNALLVVEVADKSIRWDRGPKLKVYAKHGVSEVWIEDLTTDTLLVFREPSSEAYKAQLTLHRGDSIAPLAFPKLLLSVTDLLGLDSE